MGSSQKRHDTKYEFRNGMVSSRSTEAQHIKFFLTTSPKEAATMCVTGVKYDAEPWGSTDFTFSQVIKNAAAEIQAYIQSFNRPSIFSSQNQPQNIELEHLEVNSVTYYFKNTFEKIYIYCPKTLTLQENNLQVNLQQFMLLVGTSPIDTKGAKASGSTQF